jgi:hypothetical protein
VRILAGLAAMVVAVGIGATLPPLSDDAKAKAADTAAKSAWADKVGAYQTCRADERVAEAYRKNLKAAGKDVPAAVATPPCADPGPFAAAAPATKPLEASGAHSPPETATSPPSSNATQRELSGGTKK